MREMPSEWIGKMEAKFVIRRLVASIILSPLVALAYSGLWLALVMLGAGGSFAMFVSVLPSVLVVWVLFVTLYPALMAFVERITRP
jgi:hypothetical protein